MAACVYVLVIVFGTTDLDLLIGKGVKLPFVNVEVPIVGFYVFAPYILVIVHFNLLLQLQLLSRKLHAFDSAAPHDEEMGGLRDRLHIFPFTYYIAGRPGPRVQPLVALMVSITVIMLPLVTLLALQMVFLAYQEELYTWMQRIAIWTDIVLVAYFWPIILNSCGNWSDYLHDLYRTHLSRKRNWLPLGFFIVGLLLFLFFSSIEIRLIKNFTLKIITLFIDPKKVEGINIDTILPLLTGMFLITLSGIAALFLHSPKPLQRFSCILIAVLGTGGVFFLFISSWLDSGQVSEISLIVCVALIVSFAIILFRHPDAPQGSLVLLLSVFLGFPLTLAMLVDGGSLEHNITSIQGSHDRSTLFCDLFLKTKRILKLPETVLLAKQPQPETIALIRSDEWTKGIRQVEPLDLKNRNLRHADLARCILVRVDLRNADLKGADLLKAQLQGARLSGAQLQGTKLAEARLQGANLYNARFQGADLSGARLQVAFLAGAWLQGAILPNARLQGAKLSRAQLQGADLSGARLHGADLSGARLHGASLSNAQLQGAYLWDTQLQGAELRYADIYGVSFLRAGTALIDARDVVLLPMPDSVHVEICNSLQATEADKEKKEAALERLRRVTMHGIPVPSLDSCLVSTGTQLKCTNQLHEPEYIEQLHTYLVNLACTSPYIARGIIRQISYDTTSSRFGLASKLVERLDAGGCNGLADLSNTEMDKLRKQVKSLGQP